MVVLAGPAGIGKTSLGPRPDPASDRFALFEAVYADLAALAPVLLLADDLQWVDESSLRAITYLLRHIAGDDVVLAASLRTDDPGDDRSAAGAELMADTTLRRVDVRALDDRDSAACLVAVAGARPPADVVGQALALAGGNPFYLTELDRTWRAHGSLRVPAGSRTVSYARRCWRTCRCSARSRCTNGRRWRSRNSTPTRSCPTPADLTRHWAEVATVGDAEPAVR